MLEALNGNIGRGGVDANTIFELDMDKPVGSVDLYDKVSSLKLQRTGGTSQFVDHPEYGKVFEFTGDTYYKGLGEIQSIPLAASQYWVIDFEFLVTSSWATCLFESGHWGSTGGSAIWVNHQTFIQFFQADSRLAEHRLYFTSPDPGTMNKYRISRRPDGTYVEDLTRELSFKTTNFETQDDAQLYIGTSGERPPSYIFRGYLKNLKISKLEI